MIQLEELKSKLLELKPQIDDYRSAIGMDDLVKKQQELEEKTADPNFWNDLENSSRVLQQISQIKSKGRHLYKDGKRLRRLGHAD